MRWLWYFIIYSFLGFLLEVAFARMVGHPKRDRKCFLLLPLCPVYGLAMTAVLALVPADAGLVTLSVLGGLICTGVEYLVHLFYDRVLHVQFWDYSLLRGHVQGRICPRFAVIWGALSALAVRWVQPAVARLAGSVPPEAVFALWLLLAADCVLTAALLARHHDTALLGLGALAAQARASSQSSTSL